MYPCAITDRYIDIELREQTLRLSIFYNISIFPVLLYIYYKPTNRLNYMTCLYKT
jgi:hypothetical protein